MICGMNDWKQFVFGFNNSPDRYFKNNQHENEENFCNLKYK